MTALVIGLGTFSALAVQSINESLQRTLQERLSTARIVATYLDQTLNNVLGVLRDTARAGDIADPTRFSSRATALRDALRESGIAVNSVYVLDSTGQVTLAEPADPGIVGYSMSNYAEIKRNIDAGLPTVSGLITKPLGETPTVLFSVPIHDAGGAITGVLACSIDTEQSRIGAFAKGISVGKTGYVEVVDSNGIVVIRTSPGSPPGDFESSDHPTRFAQLISTGQATVGTCHRCHTTTGNAVQKKPDILAFAPLSTVPWGIAIRQSESEALYPTRQLELRLGILGVILLACTLVLLWAMLQNIVKPIRMLTNAANRLASNDYDAETPIQRGDEIGNLSEAFQKMRAEVQKSRREMVSRYQEAKSREQLRGQLLTSVIDAQEQERRRIARELHDEYGQTLTGLTMSIESVEASLPPEQSRLKEKLAATKSSIGHALDDMRRLILDLRPPSLDELGLATAIKTYAQRNLGDADINVTVDTRSINGRFPQTLEVTLFRIVQEAVHNVAKHAAATNVSILLQKDGDKVVAVVQDDGRGFDTSAVLRAGAKGHSWGIIGMRERAALMGGTFNITSEKGRGTRLEVEIPIDESRWGDQALQAEEPS
jgi:signal transduction histidine kinase